MMLITFDIRLYSSQSKRRNQNDIRRNKDIIGSSIADGFIIMRKLLQMCHQQLSTILSQIHLDFRLPTMKNKYNN